MIGDMKSTKMGQFAPQNCLTKLPRSPFGAGTGFIFRNRFLASNQSPQEPVGWLPAKPIRAVGGSLVFALAALATGSISTAQSPEVKKFAKEESLDRDLGSNDFGVGDREFDLRSRSLFDGEILAGFEGDASWFRIEDGCIVAGRLDQPIPKNQFLATTEKFDNFDLRLEVRMRGQGRNAGVQFRSRRPGSRDDVPAHEMIGYQADVGEMQTRSIWGALYDESRRRRMLVLPEPPFDVPWTKPKNADDDQTNAPEQTEWVKMRIVCYGPRIQISLNGTRTVDYLETDDDIPEVGVIGLQIHSGKPAEAWYRNLRILGLD